MSRWIHHAPQAHLILAQAQYTQHSKTSLEDNPTPRNLASHHHASKRLVLCSTCNSLFASELNVHAVFRVQQ